MGEWSGETVGPDVWETCRELIPVGSVFAFLAEYRGRLFPAAMFADMYPSANGRPSMPPQVLAAAITLQALHGLSDFETVQELRCDLRWKAACGLGLHDTAFDSSLLAYFRRRLDALRLLGHLPERQLGEKAANAVGLLALVAGQDVEPADDCDGRDGRWRITRATAPERIVSVVDPDARHVHKTRRRGGRLQPRRLRHRHSR
ncbi:transposase, partial [Kitasatospora phosalacinea]|uniref:transposase n=1 Tax=Kitasatospora phosalacinea TaxID=2065 RepID=UPI00052714C9